MSETKRVTKEESYDYCVNNSSNNNIAVAVRDNRIGEKGWLANPNDISSFGREKSVELMERDLLWLLDSSISLTAKFRDMKGSRIACDCPSHLPCHVDAIVKLIDEV